MARYYKGILIQEDPVMPVLDAAPAVEAAPVAAPVAAPELGMHKPVKSNEEPEGVWEEATLQKKKKADLEAIALHFHIGLKSDVEYTKKDLVDLILKAQSKHK